MNELVVTFAILQAVGATVGAASAVWGELAYLRALRDGVVSRGERAHLDAIAGGLKFGMLLLLVSSLGLDYEAYVQGAALQPALTPVYWSFILLALLVTLVAWALSRRKVSFALGSAAIFTGWWFLLYFALGQFPALSFGATIAVFVVAVAFFYVLLRTIRYVAAPKGAA